MTLKLDTKYRQTSLSENQKNRQIYNIKKSINNYSKARQFICPFSNQLISCQHFELLIWFGFPFLFLHGKNDTKLLICFFLSIVCYFVLLVPMFTVHKTIRFIENYCCSFAGWWCLLNVIVRQFFSSSCTLGPISGMKERLTVSMNIISSESKLIVFYFN